MISLLHRLKLGDKIINYLEVVKVAYDFNDFIKNRIKHRLPINYHIKFFN
jgi:hypothetical protein